MGLQSTRTQGQLVPSQLVPKLSCTHGQLVPKSTRTQVNSYPSTKETQRNVVIYVVADVNEKMPFTVSLKQSNIEKRKNDEIYIK